MSATAAEGYPAIIGGERVENGRTLEDMDPSMGRPFAAVARRGEAGIDQAARAARGARERLATDGTGGAPAASSSTTAL